MYVTREDFSEVRGCWKEEPPRACPFCGGYDLEHCEASGPQMSYAIEEVPYSKWPHKTFKNAIEACNRRADDE